jgi:hypothetical protein
MKTTNSIPFVCCLLLAAQLALAQGTNDPASGKGVTFAGQVLETTNVSTYTYVCLQAGNKMVWAATTRFPVKVGDSVVVVGGMPMKNYHSKAMNRDFDVIFFTEKILVGDSSAAAALPASHPPISGDAGSLIPGHPSLSAPPAAAKIDLTGIKLAEGGKTVKEIYADSTALAGKTVTVRGKIVKYNKHILGKNWLHIEDGSGTLSDHNNDLTVTSTGEAAVGDTVLVTGTVSTNRDFGAGYRYGVMIENARVTAE